MEERNLEKRRELLKRAQDELASELDPSDEVRWVTIEQQLLRRGRVTVSVEIVEDPASRRARGIHDA